MRVVFDSNVYISGLAFGGMPRQVLVLSASYNVEFFLSSMIYEEVTKVLETKLKWSTAEINRLFGPYSLRASWIEPSSKLKVSRDVKDNHVIELAIDANAGCIVTGDKDLLVLGRYKNIKIIKPADFLVNELWK